MRALSQSEIAGHVARIDEDGFTVVEDAFGNALSTELNTALAEVEHNHQIGYRDTAFEGTKTVRIYNLLALHRAFEKIPVAPSVLPIVEAVLDDQLQLSSLSAICLGPGQEAQPVHADTNMIPLPRPHTPISVNSMWALTDFTEANGATRIVPGSHRFDHNPDYGGSYDTECTEMAAGSVLIWNSALWHGGGENQTGERRNGIASYYCAGWIRQQENQQLGIPMERLKGFERRLQELCGFSVYHGIYGHIDNRDPIEILGRERGRPMIWQASERHGSAGERADGS
jgi:ectoine hydroxylase-related dioxygenase (phytanoyl-CoA dioxygenase family)